MRWYVALILAAVVGSALYAAGASYEVVYVLRNIVRHLASGSSGVHFLPLFGIIRLVTGPLGTGKSYYMVRKAIDSLLLNKMVVTNFAMDPTWIEQVVYKGKLLKGRRKHAERLERFEKRYVHVDSLQDLMRLRIVPEAPYAERGLNGEMRIKEGSCVVFLDEAHRWMNARDWTKDNRGELLEFFALARKMGFEIYMASQRAENLDVQVRELFEDHIMLKNLRRSARILGMRVIPMNVFIAGWYNHAYPKEPMRTERYRLKWYKRLYDTMDTSSFGLTRDAGADTLWLPRTTDGIGTPQPEAQDGGAALAVPPSAPMVVPLQQPPGHPPMPAPDPSLPPAA